MTDFQPLPMRRRKKGRVLGVMLTPLRFTGRLLRWIVLRPLLLILLALLAVPVTVGTPHVAWDYQCAHSTRGGGFCQEANWCAYYGVQGRRVVFPPRGETCDLVTFLHVDWDAAITDLSALIFSTDETNTTPENGSTDHVRKK